MRTLVLSAWLVLLACGAAATPARGDEARVEVATLDGAPVYHWRTFTSEMPDDVDRALILREFQRKHFTLPPKIVAAAVQEKIAADAGGDVNKFAQQLRRKGASLEDFRLFTSEEIILSAMLYQNPTLKGAYRARWLAGLRAGTTVKSLDVKSAGGR